MSGFNEYTVLESLKPHVCLHCAISFSRFDLYRSHCRRHSKVSFPPNQVKKYRKPVWLQQRLFTSQLRHTSIRINCNEKTDKRSKCDKKLKREAKHDKLKSAPVPQQNKTKRRRHTPYSELPRKFKCTKCDKAFKDNSHRKRHEAIHDKPPKPPKPPGPRKRIRPSYKNNPKNEKCKFCLKSFVRKADRISHERIHTGDKPHKCGFCPKTFAQKIQLNLHVALHTGEMRYECQFCDKGFARKDSWVRHEIVTHKYYSMPKNESLINTKYGSNLKVLPCKYCEKVFTNKSHLELHERSHVGEKPHECKSCGKKFNHKSNLKEHERVHSDVKPFKCDVCGYRCRYSSNLKSHMASHSKARPFKCDICGDKFKRRDTLSTHRQSHERKRKKKNRK